MRKLQKRFWLFLSLLALAATGSILARNSLAQTDERVTIVVHEFTVAPGVQWPSEYDLKELQKQMVDKLTARFGTRARVVAERPENSEKVLVLDGVILSWTPENSAVRRTIDLGLGRESAKIDYSLVDASGKKVFNRVDTVRTSMWGGTAGSLADPLVSKIVDRISKSKVIGKEQS